MLLTEILSAQDLSKTKTAQQIQIKQDTIHGRIMEQKVYKYETDSAFINKQDTTLKNLDVIIKKKQKKK